MHAPDEARLIERMWGLICNSRDILVENTPADDEQSRLWRQAMRWTREEFFNWLAFWCLTHPEATRYDPDAEPSIGELIDSLKLVCTCGECDGVWISRYESELIQQKLKNYAVQDHDDK